MTDPEMADHEILDSGQRCPRVTVVIATFNLSEVLPYSIGSVLRQSFVDWELLVIGDGCTDNSAEVVAAAAAGDPRIRWINLPRNTGHQSGPNNEGLRQGTGDIVAYLGHDDLWLPHHLEVLVEALDSRTNPADIAFGLVELIPNEGAVRSCVPSNGAAIGAWRWHPPTGLAHRRQLARDAGGWRRMEDVSVAPETELVARLIGRGATAVFVARLVAVKFPASLRKDSYRLRRSDEQSAWAARIAAEPDFEQRELVEIASRRLPPWRQQLRWSFRQRVKRVVFRTMRGGPPSRWERWYVRRALRSQRRFRGLDPLPVRSNRGSAQ